MKNLLVITNGYPQLGTNRYNKNFVKEFTDLVSDYFEEVYVISPQPYFPKFLRRFKIFERFYIHSNFHNYNYNNIKVFYPTYFTLPINIFREKNDGKIQFKKVLRIIEKNNLKFDIVHCHFLQNGITGANLKKLYKNVKVIVHCHDSSLKSNLESNCNKYINMFKGIDKCISFCKNYDEINRFLEENKIENKNIYIPNFVNTNKFYPQKRINELKVKYGYNSDDKILICVGNLIYKHKGQNDILEIWKDLEKEINNIHLILIGDGPDKKKLLYTIKHKNLNKIHYLGPKSNETLLDYLNISDLFIFPSRYESFGIVQIESMSCGTPIIAYKNGGSEYIIKDDKLGTIIEEQNSELLKQGIIKLLNKKLNREYLHKFIDSKYSGEIVKEKLIDLYFN